MKRTTIRLLTFLISLSLLASVVIACAKQDDSTRSETSRTTTATEATVTAAPTAPATEITEPSTTEGESTMTTSFKDMFPGNETGANIPYNQSQYRIDFKIWQPLSEPGIVFNDADELADYFTREAHRFYFDQQGGKGLMASVNRYNENFFKHNILIFVRVMSGSGSDHFYIDRVGKTADAVKVHVGVDVAEIGTMDMAGHHLVIEIARKDLPAGDWTLEVTGAGTNPGPRAGRGNDIAYF